MLCKHLRFILSITDACHSGSSIFPEASWFYQISRLFPVHFSQGKLVELEEIFDKFKRILRRCCVCTTNY